VRLIDADALLINQREGLAGEEEIWMLEDIISAPTIDAVEVVHGEWVETEEDWRHQMAWWECSECGFPVSRTYNYCPHCGADMREREDE